MKKFVLGILVILALTMAANAAVTQNIKIPIDQILSGPCTGEDIELTGELHLLSTLTEDGAGGYHAKYHANYAGVSGVGLTTGTKYQINGGFNTEYNIAADGFPSETTAVANYGLIAPGKGNNYKGHALFHITVNANGEVTAEIDSFEVECQ